MSESSRPGRCRPALYSLAGDEKLAPRVPAPRPTLRSGRPGPRAAASWNKDRSSGLSSGLQAGRPRPGALILLSLSLSAHDRMRSPPSLLVAGCSPPAPHPAPPVRAVIWKQGPAFGPGLWARPLGPRRGQGQVLAAGALVAVDYSRLDSVRWRKKQWRSSRGSRSAGLPIRLARDAPAYTLSTNRLFIH